MGQLFVRSGFMHLFILMWNRLEETIAIFLFSALLVFGFFQIVSRFGVIPIPLDWTEELSRYAFIALVYISASLGIAHKRHVRVEIIENFVSPHIFKYMNLFVDIVWCAFNLLIAYEGYLFAYDSLETLSPVLEWDMGYIFMIIPVTFVLMAVRVLVNIIESLKNFNEKVEENK